MPVEITSGRPVAATAAMRPRNVRSPLAILKASNPSQPGTGTASTANGVVIAARPRAWARSTTASWARQSSSNCAKRRAASRPARAPARTRSRGGRWPRGLELDGAGAGIRRGVHHGERVRAMPPWLRPISAMASTRMARTRRYGRRSSIAGGAGRRSQRLPLPFVTPHAPSSLRRASRRPAALPPARPRRNPRHPRSTSGCPGLRQPDGVPGRRRRALHVAQQVVADAHRVLRATSRHHSASTKVVAARRAGATVSA